MNLEKVATDAFFDELKQIMESGAGGEAFQKLAHTLDFESLLKEAGPLDAIRKGIANVAGKVSPTLNKPVMQVAQEAAHKMQHSPSSFVKGMGEVLHHKSQTPGKMFLAAANPVGTAAETLAAGAGTSASKGLSSLGGKIQAAHAPADAVIREGRAMTPKGRLQNWFGDTGAKMQKSFAEGGMGHNVLTKKVPLAAELGGAVGAGLALHAPVGAAGMLGKAGLVGLGKAAPVIGTALEHAPHALGAIGSAAAHAGEDLIGAKGQGVIQSLGKKLMSNPNVIVH